MCGKDKACVSKEDIRLMEIDIAMLKGKIDVMYYAIIISGTASILTLISALKLI